MGSIMEHLIPEKAVCPLDTDDLRKSLEKAFSPFLILVVSPQEKHFNFVDKALSSIAQLDVLWAEEKIQALSDIFMKKPQLIVVAFDTNDKTLEFVQLVRNNKAFKDLPVFVIFNEPLKIKHKWISKLNITEKFTPPMEIGLLKQQVLKLVEENQQAQTES